MASLLVKLEPSVYGWEKLEKDGTNNWEGVLNYAPLAHLNAMKKGDEVFYYHSNEGTDIVGIAKVAKEFYQDPTTDDDKWVSVMLKPVKAFKKPVTLSDIKANKKLQNMALVRIGRLSVQPVS